MACFFLEFPYGCVKGGLIAVELPFRDRPCTNVLVLPERTSGMNQEYFQFLSAVL
jgi:hypothetical protein